MLYTSCVADALPLSLFITFDELKIIIEKAINFLKEILLEYAFFGYGWDVRPQTFLTDDSAVKRNALELYWSESKWLLYTFHNLQAFWRWFYDSKHYIKKEYWILIMDKMKKILYAQIVTEMEIHYQELKNTYY